MDETSTPFLIELCGLARFYGFRITATTNGRHNPGSLHHRGRAIDVSVRGKSAATIGHFVHACQKKGFRVLDERHRLPLERVWSGPHLHIEDRHGMTATSSP